MNGEKKKKKKFGGASVPLGILEDIDALNKELRYWPSRVAFIREACLEKVRREQERLKEQRTPLSQAGRK